LQRAAACEGAAGLALTVADLRIVSRAVGAAAADTTASRRHGQGDAQPLRRPRDARGAAALRAAAADDDVAGWQQQLPLGVRLDDSRSRAAAAAAAAAAADAEGDAAAASASRPAAPQLVCLSRRGAALKLYPEF